MSTTTVENADYGHDGVSDRGRGGVTDSSDGAVVPIAENAWHDVLQSFADSSIMQSRAYAAARWPHAELERVGIEWQGRMLGAAQLVVRKIPVLGGGLAYAHFGPVWRPVHSEPNIDNFEKIVRCMVQKYVDRRGLLLRIKPAIFAEQNDAVPGVLNAEEFLCEPDESPDRFIVDLSYSLDEIKKGFSSKWRYNLKRSRKHDLEVTAANTVDGLNEFLRLYREMLSRKSFVDVSAINELPAIYENLPPGSKPHILLCSHAGTPVAGVIVSLMGDTALYLFGASNAFATKACAGYLLQWSAMEWLKTQQCRWYDLGGDSGSAGLRQFKSGMVGRCGSIVPLPGNFEKSRNKMTRAVIHLALAGRDTLRTASHLIKRNSGP